MILAIKIFFEYKTNRYSLSCTPICDNIIPKENFEASIFLKKCFKKFDIILIWYKNNFLKLQIIF